MKKTIALIGLPVVIAGLTITGSTYANYEMDSSENGQRGGMFKSIRGGEGMRPQMMNSENGEMMRGGKGMKGQNGERGQKGQGFMQFIDPELDETAKEELKAIMDAHKEEMEPVREQHKEKFDALRESFKSQFEDGEQPTEEQIEAHKTEMEDLKEELHSSMDGVWEAHMADIRPYVAEDKLEEFDAMVAEGPKHSEMKKGNGERGGKGQYMNKGQQGERMSNRADNAKGTKYYKHNKMAKKARRALSSGNEQKVATILDRLSTEKLEKISDRVTTAIEKVESSEMSDERKEKILGIYNDIKDMVNERLSTDEDETDVISELLGDLE